MSEDAARARVHAFVRDFHAAWLRMGIPGVPAGFSPFDSNFDPSFDFVKWSRANQADFETWDRELAALAEAHLIAGAKTGEEGAVGNPPPHDPDLESIVSVELTGSTGEVRTTLHDSSGAHYYLYQMALVEGGWRIAKITRTLAPPADLVLGAVDAEELLRAADTGVVATPVEDASVASALTGLFGQAAQVVDVGEIATNGAIAVLDIAVLGDAWVRPLSPRVLPGSYLVQVARDSADSIVALRLVLDEREPETWHPANRLAAGHEIANFYNTVTIADFAALAGSTKEALEVEYQAFMERVWAASAERELLSSLDDHAVMVYCGDQDLAAYWGVAADGTIAVLLVDFQVHMENITTTHVVPWRIGLAEDPELARREFEIIDRHDHQVFRFRSEVEGTYVDTIQVLEPAGTPLRGERGSFEQGGYTERRWSPRLPTPQDATVEVTVVHGRRHI